MEEQNSSKPYLPDVDQTEHQKHSNSSSRVSSTLRTSASGKQRRSSKHRRKKSKRKINKFKVLMITIVWILALILLWAFLFAPKEHEPQLEKIETNVHF